MKKTIAVILAVLFISTLLASCASTTTTGENIASTPEEPGAPANPPSPADPVQTSDNIIINAARPIPDDVSFPDGDSIENNVWTRLYETDLGVELNYIWTTPVAQYDQKLSISIISNDLPDIFQVNATQLKQLVDDGQIADLTDIYNNYASDYTKDVMTQDGGNALLSATFNGKLMAIPKMGSGIGNSNVLWVRTDWLEALGMDEPKSIEDVLDIARSFTYNDPDGNGQNDTYGLAINKDLWGMFASLVGFFNGFDAYPNMWVEKGGKLESGNIQPEMREALQAVQELFLDGCIDPEFGVKDGWTVGESVSQGKIGLMYGFFWNMGWLSDAKTANPDMEWKPYAIVGAAGKSALAQVPFAVSTYYVVSAECNNPEAAVQMLNLQLDRTYGENAEPDKYNVDAVGNPIFEYPLIYCEPPLKNLDAQIAVSAALENGDTSALNAEELGYYNQIVSYREGNPENWAACWGAEMMYGPAGSLNVLNNYVRNGKVYDNRFFGPPTDAMAQADAILDQTQLQVFTGIILGDDISAFDQYVNDWKSLGGDSITAEINQWYSER